MADIYEQFKTKTGTFTPKQEPTIEPQKEGILKRVGRAILPKAIEEKIIGPKQVSTQEIAQSPTKTIDIYAQFKAKEGVFAPKQAPEAPLIPEVIPKPTGEKTDLYEQFKSKTGIFGVPTTEKISEKPIISEKEPIKMFAQKEINRLDENIREAEDRQKKSIIPEGVMTSTPLIISPEISEIKNLRLAKESYQSLLTESDKSPGFFKSFYEGVVDKIKEPEKLIPFLGSIDSLKEGMETLNAYKKQEKGEALNPYEKSLVEKYKASQLPVKKELGYMVGSTLAEIPTYALEFLATGGIYSATKTAITAGAKKAIPSIIEKKLPSLALKAGSTIIAGAAQGSVNVPAISSRAAEYMLPKYEIVAGSEGDNLVQKIESKGDDFTKALTKAWGIQAVEYITERAGVILEKPTEALQKAILGKWIQKVGTSKAMETIKKGIAWNGIIGEVFEEELAELFQAPIEGREYKPPILTPEGSERLLVETLSIGAFGGLGKVSDTTIQAIGTKRAETLIPTPIPVEKTEEQKIREELDRNIEFHQKQGGFIAGTESESAALRDINQIVETSIGREITQKQIQDEIKSGALKVSPEGTITLYRAGKPSEKNELTSATFEKSVAQEFVDKAADSGREIPLFDFQVEPSDISLFIGKGEAEVLLPRSVMLEKTGIKEGVKEGLIEIEEEIDIDKQIKDWKPKGGYIFGGVRIESLNFYPKEKYLPKNYEESKSYIYWVDKLKKGGTMPPIIVEPAKSFKGYFIRDGIHRVAAAEEAGLKTIPAIIANKGSKNLIRDFGTFNEEELSSIKSQLSNFYKSQKIEIPIEKKELKPKIKKVSQEEVDIRVLKLTEELRAQYRENPKALEEMNIMMQELMASEPGYRFQLPDGEFTGVSSTFPKWLPEGLRSKDLFDKIIKNLVDIENIKFPEGNRPRQRELYNSILEELDKRLGIDTSKVRNGIMDIYEISKEATTAEEIDRGREGREEARARTEEELDREVAKLFEGEAIKEEKKEISGKDLGFIPKNLKEPSSPKAKAEVDKIIKRSEIASTISEKFGLPIRRGRFRKPGAVAIFKPDLKLIRYKSGGLPVIFHETGHFIDDKFDFSSYFISQNIGERKELVKEYGNGNPYANEPKRQAKEAFAEFVRFYYTEKDKAQKIAPQFFAIYEKRISDLPEIKDVMNTAALDYKRWLDMPSVAKVISQISFGNKDPRSLKEKTIDNIHRLYEMGIDDLHPISEWVKIAKKLGIAVEDSKNPYVLARLIRGWHGKAETFLEKGTFRRKFWEVIDGKVELKLSGKSFKEIVKPIEEKGALQHLSVYLISKRTIELSKRNIKTGISKVDAIQTIKDIEEEHKNINFEKVAQELYEYQDALMLYALESGLIEEKSLLMMRELNKNYVPFFRVMEELQSRGYMGKGFGNLVRITKKIKGSDRDIIDPLESIVKNTYSIINAAERNAVAMSMVNMSQQHYELGRMFEKLPKPLTPIKVNVGEVIESAFGALGAILPKEIKEGFSDKIVTIFKPAFFSPRGELTVLVAGKSQSFKVDPDIFRAMQSLDQEEVAMIVKILSYPAKFLRAGATLTPEFMVRNPARDQMTAFIFSKYGYIPGVDLARGVYSLLGRDNDYWMWRMGGGEHAALVSLDRESMQKKLDDVLASKGMRGLKYIKNPLQLLQVISEFGEAGTRLGEMKKGLKKGADPIQSSFASREITLDFARIGSKTKAVNMLIAFWNANVQGLDKMTRNFKERPYQTTLKAIMGLTLPSILLYFANRDDDRWKEIPQWQKDIFWIVFTEKHIWRIPKPFVLGQLFGSLPERIFEYIDNDNPEIFTALFKSIRDGATPGFIPTVLLPWIENAANYSFFLDRKLVSESKEDLPPEAQFTEYTSEFSKEIGKWLGASPIKIDNLIRGYFAGLGTYAVKSIDGILSGTGITNPIQKPQQKLEDMPLIKAFMTREPIGGSSESLNKFYQKSEEAKAGYSYYNQLVKGGRVEEGRKFLANHPELKLSPVFEAVREQLSGIRQAKDAIMKSRELSPAQKREKIDKFDRLTTDIAQKAIEIRLKQ